MLFDTLYRQYYLWTLILLSKIETIENKSEATLIIFERLIFSSDLPTETKVALQGVINKADGAEDSTNDQE